MTKWFDTNYHYIVPELERGMRFKLSSRKPFDAVPGGQGPGDRDQAGADRPAHASCSRASAPARSSTGWSCSTRSSRCTRRCSHELGRTGRRVGADRRAGAGRGPHAGRAGGARARLHAAWARSRARRRSSSTPTSTTSARRYPVLTRLPVAGIGLDFVRGERNLELISRARLARRTRRCSRASCPGATSGSTTSTAASRSCGSSSRHWPATVVVSTSCSLQHSPIDKRNEPRLDDEVLSWMSFAVQKLDEVATLARGLNEGEDAVTAALEANRKALEERERRPRAPATPRCASVSRRSPTRTAGARARSPSAARPSTSGWGCRSSRPRRSARSRRRPRSARRACSCATARSTRSSTSS